MTTNTHKILIVDDEPGILDTLERTLAGNYTVFRAGNGDEALGVLGAEEMAMTIADQRMPGMSGVLLLMRSREIQPNMIRLITGVRDGKLDFTLTKPEDAQVLVSVREVRIWQVVDVISGAVVLGVGLSRITTDVGALDALASRSRC